MCVEASDETLNDEHAMSFGPYLININGRLFHQLRFDESPSRPIRALMYAAE